MAGEESPAILKGAIYLVGYYHKKINVSVSNNNFNIQGLLYVNDKAADKIDESVFFEAGKYTPQSVADAVSQLLEDDIVWSIFPIISVVNSSYYSESELMNFLFPSQSKQRITIDNYPAGETINVTDGERSYGYTVAANESLGFNTNLFISYQRPLNFFGSAAGFYIFIPIFKSSDFINGKFQMDNYKNGDSYNFTCLRIRMVKDSYIGRESFLANIVQMSYPDYNGSSLEAYLKNTVLEKFIHDDDPFNPGGSSGTGGGGGNFDNTSSPIEIPSLPSISAADTGFISLYNPTLDQLNELANYLWSDLFDIEGWRKLFANPMDSILGLSILPVPIPSGGGKEVKVGNIGTGISLTLAGSQFVEVDCGSINVNEYWGAYLDYEPYTQAQIFLPYIGTRPISVDEIMGKTVHVVYHVDILTGACCCFVKCGDSVLYTYNGQCSIPIPITGANYTSVVNGVISIAGSIGSMVATGGASAPVAIPSIANSVVNQMKPNIEKSGSISGPAGILNMQTPYLILIRPRQALPAQQNEFIGYPSLITVQLTELTGYTEVQSIHLENIPATQEELVEIQSLLEGGVIF